MYKIIAQTPSTVSGGPWWYNGVISTGALPDSDPWTLRQGSIIPDFLILHIRAELTGGDATSDLSLNPILINSRNPGTVMAKIHHQPSSANGLTFDQSIAAWTFGSMLVLKDIAGATFERAAWLAFGGTGGALPIPFDQIYLDFNLGGTAYANGGIVRAYMEAVAII